MTQLESSLFCFGWAERDKRDDALYGIVRAITYVSYVINALPKPHTPNFLSEGVRCDLDMKIARMGHTFTYFPFGLLIERSQMTPYHKKLLGVVH